MANLVYGDDDRLVAWAETLFPGSRFRSDAKAIGLERDGAVAGVCIFDTFSTTDCLVHVVSDGKKRWMTREFIVHAMAFPFTTCGFARITSVISCNNAPSLRLADQFGWTREGVMRAAGSDGEDLILYGMLRRECRWLPLTLW